MSIRTRLVALGVATTLLATACSTTPGTSGGASTAPATKVRFQLQWVAQAQFAGYYAAKDQGYYAEEGLDVDLLLGGPQVNNVQVVASGGAEIGTAWLPNMLRSREGGTDLVSIAQILQRSGTRMVAFKDAEITSP
jgi:NitT/TauT family transport system substrate-binding protein